VAKKIRNIAIDESVWQQAKVAAAQGCVTLQEWITSAILCKVAQEKQDEQKEVT